ncbi:tetratricopeptide repeat protein [Flagellimonas baculiformis]|uniref:tetratricopeptide repeat protein n=1 Tax=Flagellimonas baculiformis TaxID=3067310 RepID=UPI00296FA2E4|nr:tetratricopeptide repeat protein [Muricauda sp. D6]
MDKEPTYWTLEEQDLFERYLLDGMDAQERAAFESQLQSDSNLNTKFLEFKGLFRTIEEEGLRSKLNDFHKQLEDDAQIRPLHTTSYRLLFRVAAAIALLIALGGIWYFYIPNANERLFNAYFTPDPGLPTVMGNSDNYDFYEAMVDYKQGNYTTAAQKWENLLSQKMDNDTINYFLGAVYLANEEPSKAIPYFDRVLGNTQSSFQSEAAYYKGLAHLKNNEVEAALKSLEQTSDEKGRELAKKLRD